MTALRPCGLDLGSRACGFVAATTGARVAVVGALTIPVPECPSPPNVGLLIPVADSIMELVVGHGCDLLVMEMGPFYSSGDSAAKAAAIARNREVFGAIRVLLEAHCARIGIPTATISRQAWAPRLVPGVHGVTSAQAAAAVLEGLTAEELVWFAGDGGQHARDALGALRGHLIGPAAKKVRERTGRVRKAKPGAAAESPERAEVRALKVKYPACAVAVLRMLAEGPQRGRDLDRALGVNGPTTARELVIAGRVKKGPSRFDPFELVEE